MKFEDALNEYLAGLKPPTQLATYQDLNYMTKHWNGNRPEHKPKKSYITKPKKKRKKKKDPEDVKSDITIEQYVQKRRDTPPNYLNRALTPFFMKSGIDDQEEHKPKEKYMNDPPKKKRKKNGRKTRRSSY